MRDFFPAFIVIIPMTISLLAPLVGRISKVFLRLLTMFGFFLSVIFSAIVLRETLTVGNVYYNFGNWEAPYGIEYVIDPLGATIAVMVSFIALLIVIYSREFFKDEGWLKNAAYYSLFGLMVTGLLGMTVSGDAFNLYVFLEISSLSTYALIALGGPRGTVAAFKYLLIGTVGASLYLFSVAYLYGITGTLNFADMSERILPLMDSPAMILIVILLFLGLGIKMALFPLHMWLPDAHSYAPYPLSAFMSGVLIKVPAYVMIRYYFFIFDVNHAVLQNVLQIAGILAAIGIVYGSVMAIAQTEFKRMLAYSSVAGIGYVVMGMSMGNAYGMIGAVFHIFNHAFMKVALFFIAGGIKQKFDHIKIDEFKGLLKKMPVSMYSFLILAFSMIGLPPTAGFFSKWYLVNGALQEGLWFFIVVIVVSSVLNAVYFFRIIEFAFLNKEEKERKCKIQSRFELPLSMLMPIVVMTLLVLALGIFNADFVSAILTSVVPEVIK